MSEPRRGFKGVLFVLLIAAISLGAGLKLAQRFGFKSPLNLSVGGKADLWTEGTPEETPVVPKEVETEVAEIPLPEAGHDFSRLGPNTFVDLARQLDKTVVNISTTKVVQRSRPGFPMIPSPFGEGDPSEDFFQRFFGDLPPQIFKQRSLGSGFIINKEGFIVTNNHVIENADEVRVRLSDEKEYPAKVIGRDPKTDIALIKVDASEELPVAALGDSDQLQIGEWVVAIGNPFGLSHTVTIGIVSAKGRVIGAGPYDDFVQTDASINPGNSGGPLINLRGEVIGINTAIHATGQGIGFAIPINIAKAVLPPLKEAGKVIRGWLGVTIQKVTPDLAESFGLKGTEGALVSGVLPGSPAEGKLKQGDVIVQFDGKKISEMHELPAFVAGTSVGKKVELEIFRENKRQTVEIEIGELKDEMVTGEQIEEEDASEKLGLRAQDITPEIARQLRLEDRNGIVVTDVEAGSVADFGGIQRGDVIREISVDGKDHKIANMQDYTSAISSIRESALVRFRIQREGGALFIVIRVPASTE